MPRDLGRYHMPPMGEIDDLLDSDDEQTTDTDKNPVKAQREHIKSLTKDLKAAQAREKQRDEEFTAIKEQLEKGVFDQLKLNEKQVKLFRAANPDTTATAEVVQQFLTDYDLAPAASESDDTEDEVSDDKDQETVTEGFSPTSGGTPPPGKTYTSKDVTDLIMSGRGAEAQRIVEEAVRRPSILKIEHEELID